MITRFGLRDNHQAIITKIKLKKKQRAKLYKLSS